MRTSKPSDERYTPPEIVAKVTQALGFIGLDPTAASHRKIQALNHITADNDCFKTDWAPLLIDRPTVFMNPPYSRSNLYLNRMVSYIDSGVLKAAVTLTLAGVLFNKRTQPIVRQYATAIAIPNGRINFINGGDSNDRDVCFILWGHSSYLEAFNHAFDTSLILEQVL
jgi:hypothetical protein